MTEDYEEIQVNLDYAGDTNTFSALDRFGRVTDQVWNDYQPDPDVPLDAFSYGYDRVGNRVWKENVGAAEIPATPVHLDELYDYDLVNQLSGVERGNLVDGQDGKEIDGTPAFTQDWDLDALGNWGTFNDDGTSQTREVDEANQIKKIDGSSDDVDHDAAGNMIRVPKLDGSGEHFCLKYDAWNRLAAVYDDNGTTLIAEYQYDGTGRRIVKGVDDGTDGSFDTFTHYFHSGTQVIETREGDDVSGAAPAAESLEPKYQNIWSPRYVDSMILRDECDSQGDIITANRIYYLSDANYNVTALVNAASGSVVERYLYTPYGTVTVLEPNFSSDGDGESDCDNTTLYTGRELDPETELMYYRARYYHSELGRFVSRDPIGYLGGNLNLFGYVSSDPVSRVDPSGLAPWYDSNAKTDNTWFTCGDKTIAVTYRKCSGEAKAQMQKNICDAYAILGRLDKCLDDGVITKDSPIVTKWFGTIKNEQDWRDVKTVIKKMMSGIDNVIRVTDQIAIGKPLQITCTDDPRISGAAPKVTIGGDQGPMIYRSGNILIGPRYCGQTAHEQVMIYLHELSHATANTKDYAYWEPNLGPNGVYIRGRAWNLRKYPPDVLTYDGVSYLVVKPTTDQKINNASTYEYFIRDFYQNIDTLCPSATGVGRGPTKEKDM